jgi:hypothetical protein
MNFENALEDAMGLLDNHKFVPLVISFHAIHCEYTVFAITIPIPVIIENETKIKVDLANL